MAKLKIGSLFSGYGGLDLGVMEVPKGWITDCGLSRNEELKACGNGVVPQQAVLALRYLLRKGDDE